MTRKDDCTTCFDDNSRSGEMESTIATCPSTGSSPGLLRLHLLRQLALQRLGQALAAPHAAARQQPVLRALPSGAGTAERGRASEKRRDTDARLRAH